MNYNNIFDSKQIESLTKSTPIFTKEQKIVQKALTKINYYIYSAKNKNVGLIDLYQAIGLLESLLFNDDKESNNANHHP